MCDSVEVDCTLQSALARWNLRFVWSCKTLVAAFEKSFAVLGACLGFGVLLLQLLLQVPAQRRTEVRAEGAKINAVLPAGSWQNGLSPQQVSGSISSV